MTVLAIWLALVAVVVWLDRRAARRERLERIKGRVLAECLRTRQLDALVEGEP